MTMTKKIIAIVLTALFILSLAACSSKSTETTGKNTENTTSNTTNSTETKKEPTAVDKIKQAGKLIMATSAEYPPFESIDPKDGKTVIGFDIDVANAVAKKLGVSLEIKDMDFNGLLGALIADKADMIIAGMSATDERKKSVDFSKTYFTDTFVVVVKEGVENIKTPADLNGKKVGGQLGSTGEGIAKSIPGIQYKAMNDNDQLVMEVKSGRLDAVVLNLITCRRTCAVSRSPT
jgi:polar amino acid transport system substrate-binding protein